MSQRGGPVFSRDLRGGRGRDLREGGLSIQGERGELHRIGAGTRGNGGSNWKVFQNMWLSAKKVEMRPPFESLHIEELQEESRRKITKGLEGVLYLGLYRKGIMGNTAGGGKSFLT